MLRSCWRRVFVIVGRCTRTVTGSGVGIDGLVLNLAWLWGTWLWRTRLCGGRVVRLEDVNIGHVGVFGLYAAGSGLSVGWCFSRSRIRKLCRGTKGLSGIFLFLIARGLGLRANQKAG